MSTGTIATLVGVAIVGALAIDSMEIINPGEVGVPVTFGNVGKETLQPGVHFVAPLFTRVERINTQEQRSDIDVDAATKDLQQLPGAAVAVNWSVDAGTANDIVRNFGNRDNIFNRVINPNVEEALKAATAQYTATELLTKRNEFSADLKQRITTALKPYPLQVRDVNIINFRFSDAFTQAVEANQVASRKKATAEAEAAANVATAEGQAKARVAEARGQSEAQRLLQQSATPEVIRLKQLEVQRAMVDKWDGKLPKITSSGNGGMILQLPAMPENNGK